MFGFSGPKMGSKSGGEYKGNAVPSGVELGCMLGFFGPQNGRYLHEKPFFQRTP